MEKNIATYDMPWVNIRDPKAFIGLAANYDVDGTPYFVIISPDGKIVDMWFGFSNNSLKNKMREIVN